MTAGAEPPLSRRCASTSAPLQGGFHQRQQQQHEHHSCRIPARAPTSFSAAGPRWAAVCVARFKCIRVRTRAGAHRSVPEMRGTAAPPPLPEEPSCPLPSPPRCGEGDMTALARASGSACLHCPPTTGCESFASMGWSNTGQVPCLGGPHSTQGGGTQKVPLLRDNGAVNPCDELRARRRKKFRLNCVPQHLSNLEFADAYARASSWVSLG